MLVLKRKREQRIRIACPDGTVIWVQLMTAHGGNARIGIEAPKSVEIYREEVYDALQQRYEQHQQEQALSQTTEVE